MTLVKAASPAAGRTRPYPDRSIAARTARFSATMPMALQAPQCTASAGAPCARASPARPSKKPLALA